MNKIFIFLLVIVCHYSYGQEPHGGSFHFKVYNEGELIKFPNTTWEIHPKNSVFEDSTIVKHEVIYAYDFNAIAPEQTLGGGLVSDDFYLDIIHNKDTMRIFPPSFKDQYVELDSISFRKGTYTIPVSVHDFRVISKKIIHHQWFGKNQQAILPKLRRICIFSSFLVMFGFSANSSKIRSIMKSL